MKNTYKTIRLFVVMAVLMATKAGAQLNGPYTINSAQPTGGTNFQSFSAFAAVINTAGVSGPVEVNVAPGSGPYNEQVQFLQVPGASSANKVTIKGNGALITFNATSGQPWVIAMNGTDHFRVENLQVQATNATYAFALKMWGDANFNTFSTCSFSVPINNTGTQSIPVSISGNGTSYSAAGSAGNYNTFDKCITFGGYTGFGLYGTSSQPYITGNVISNCTILDFYYSGIWNYVYMDGTQILYNTFRCPTRTNTTTKYAIYCYGAQNTLMEGNLITELFGPGLQTSTGTAYGIYCYYNTTSSYTGLQYPSPYRNIIRNNVISDIRYNGTLYGIYAYYYDGEVYNNTVSLDYSGSTAGSTYGIYVYGYPANYVSHVHNNNVTITRGGNGTKYCYYNAAGIGGSDVTCDWNNFYINAPAGTNYVGYHTALATNLAALQSQGANQNGWSVDPMYVNLAGGDLHPTNATINNMAIPKGLIFDQEMAVRDQNTPDIGALEFLSPQCSGSPGLNTVTTPTYAICPGESVTMGLGTLTTTTGFSYQWQVSNMSSVGPFTVVPGANSLFYTAPSVTANTWYSLVTTCTLAGGTSANYVGQVQVAGPSSSVVPYYEDFEGIGLGNRLPNCSWLAPELGGNFKTYVTSNSGNRVPRSGTSFASFQAPSANNYVYTSPIWMDAGVTYSAAVHYATEYFGYNNWTNLSILVGPNQSPTGLVQVASVSPAMSGPYKLLDGIFTVPSSGFYHVAIRANGMSGSATYLSIDDISVTIPCYGPGAQNSPTLQVSASSTTVCANEAVNITANGADEYVWSNSASGPGIVDNPMTTTNYIVWGTNTLTGCTATINQMIVVNPAPAVQVLASTPTVCVGSPVNLSAFGQNVIAFSWNNGATGPIISVSPTGNTTYTVIGTNAFGCSGTADVAIAVVQLPNVTVNSSNPDVACQEEAIMFTATGGVSYQWLSSNASLYHGNPITIVPGSTTVYTVIATNAAGCSNKTTITQNVVECVGLAEAGALAGLKVYPNPTSGAFTVELNNNSVKTVEVTDITGRVIIAKSTESSSVELNIADLSNGIYYVKIQSENASEVIKVVKQ